MSMTALTSARQKLRRGYMLVEAVVAGGVVAVALTALVHQFGIADRRASASVRAIQAAEALQDGIGRAFTVDFGTLATFSDTPPGCVGRTVTVTTMGAPPCMNCKRAVVVVTFKDTHNVTRTLTETVYRNP